MKRKLRETGPAADRRGPIPVLTGLWTRWAARVVKQADRDNPADRVLRTMLRQETALAPEDRTGISRAVFAYFRWRGWIEPEARLEDAIPRAVAMQERFNQTPDALADEELVSKAIPDWIGTALAVEPAWVRSIQAEPELWLRARRGRGEALARTLSPGCEAGPRALPEALEYWGGQDLFRTPEFHRGEFEVQDIASQAVGSCCGARPGETWWDMCAGEGGKTLHLSDLMANKGLIVATDRAGWRLRSLQRRAARAGAHNYRTKLWVNADRAPTKTLFDGVLLDAPCSGLGTWRRNPHARWTLRDSDVKELSAIQWRLLAQGAAQVKPGGRLVYAVCTLTRAETTELATRFDREFPQFEPMQLQSPFQENAKPSGTLMLWPQLSGGNGMFIAGWQRTGVIKSG